MDKEEPNFNLGGKTSDSELVLEGAKIEQKYEKEQEKRRFAQLFLEKLRRKLKTNVFVKIKSTTIFHGLHSCRP